MAFCSHKPLENIEGNTQGALESENGGDISMTQARPLESTDYGSWLHDPKLQRHNHRKDPVKSTGNKEGNK